MFLDDFDDYVAPGHMYNPEDHDVIVQPVLQIQTINGVDIAEEIIDVTASFYMVTTHLLAIVNQTIILKIL